MTRIPLTIEPGINADDTTYSSSGVWADGSNVRFRLGHAQVIGGWQSLTQTLLTGVCRKAMPWTDNLNVLNIAFGTHSNLEVWQGGSLYDITPAYALQTPVQLGTNPITTANASTTVSISHTAHGFTTADTVYIFGATAVATVTLNGPYSITVVDVNTYTVTAGSAANATTTGGGSLVVVTKRTAYASGQIDGTGTSGFGTGAYGTGAFGSPSTTDYFPRTWSFAAWGQNLLASYRGGPIYQWTNSTGTPAAIVTNAPPQVQYMLVAPNGGGYQAFALGCSQEADGVYNPMCIRHSSVRVLTEWNTGTATTAREYQLTGGGRLVAGAVCGPYLLVWTNDSLFLGQFVGQLTQPWRFDRISKNCGLMSPGGFVVKGQEAFWISPEGQFYQYQIGGMPQMIPCPVRSDFISNLSASQFDKVVAGSISQFGEVWWFYPDARDGYENSRYVSYCFDGPDTGKWFRGTMARTAFADAGPSTYPVGVTTAGNCYWHESGNSADGSSLRWFLQSSDLPLDENYVVNVGPIWPDIKGQVGPITMVVQTRLYPQSAVNNTVTSTLTPSQTKQDLRASGRMINLYLAGSAQQTAARIGKFEADIVKAGMR